MSGFEAARPRYTLPFAGKDYELLGTFALIEAVEYAAKAHIGVIAVQVVNNMPVSELSRVLAAILMASGHKLTSKEVGEAIWNAVGINSEEDKVLRLHLYAFLSICLAPPGRREQKAREMGEMMGEAPPAPSPGPITDGSASAS